MRKNKGLKITICQRKTCVGYNSLSVCLNHQAQAKGIWRNCENKPSEQLPHYCSCCTRNPQADYGLADYYEPIEVQDDSKDSKT
jgi:hypothetical protein